MKSTTIFNKKHPLKSNLFVLLLMCFFVSIASYSQNLSYSSSNEGPRIEKETSINEVPTTAKVSTFSINSNVNFILWFMGTKENVNSKNSIESFSKKSILTSGREPNRLLMKTLLKKAMNTKAC